MINKEDIIANQDLQLQAIHQYYPQADPSGKFFKIRDEKTPSAKLRLYKGVWYLKDFGDASDARDCFAVVMDNEVCDFKKAIEIIKGLTYSVGESYVTTFPKDDYKTVTIKSQIKAIRNNPKEKASTFLNSRKINVDDLPNNAYYYDSFQNAVVFIDSEQNVLNRRLIEPLNGETKARMSKYSGFDPIYDVLYDQERERVFLTEGIIDSLSLIKYSSLSIFTTSNLIKHSDKLVKYIQDKEVVIAFDNDDAGNTCAKYYSELIANSKIKIKRIVRLNLPEGKDINDLLLEETLGSFLNNKRNYREARNKNDNSSAELSTQINNNDESKSFNDTKNQQIEEFLSGRYDVRYNIIKQQPEYRKISEEQAFHPIDKYVLNSLRRELNQNGLNTSVQNIKSILESDFAKMVHPIQQYLNDLPAWNPEMDHIKELANTVTAENPEIWYNYLKKWLVAVVANVLNNSGCQNHTCLVITGKQGAFKTTWLDNLCPKGLTQYLFTGKLDPQNKDSLTYIAEYFLINIDDQLRQLNKRDENELKNLITTPSVKYRRPYDIYITEYPHTASFMASVNGNDFLTDPTGSRRFLPFEAIEININDAKTINIDLVYAQALQLYREEFHYWFDHKEIEVLHKHNQAFQVVSTEEQLILEYFEKPDEREAASDYLQSAIIQAHIEKFTRSRISPKKLGEALTKLGYEKWQRTQQGKTRWVWSVIKKELPQVEQENNNNPF